ncbi:hypothetical protein [Pseudomonas typographi]|uniref:hypothetical protein n=1 Tax=Pseudomonas typographi TaxID=2715964 RepID=UPI001688DD48|nr:hypothetical protein [Pseudomonas typographi]MBD1554832.1 hypothetical protein [Pseudomonas typographi]MBD1589893.1 hypothetical protein [Pseudomonas typographi]
MNLNNQPTVDDLARLFAGRRDTHDSHILWVCESGEVHVEALGPEACEHAFEKQRPSMRARLRTYRRGGGYVGKKAAADHDFLSRVLYTLKRECLGLEHGAVKVVDRYC